jgi:signal transduction histidine kinase
MFSRWYWTRIRLQLIAELCQESVIQRFFRIDDHVKELQDSPPAMFFYNQRTLFFLGSGAFLILISVISPIIGVGRKEIFTIFVMWTFWTVAGSSTLILHPKFRTRLTLWAESALPNRLPPLFGRYFLLDFILVLFMIVIGKEFGLNLEMFALLLIANTIVYSAYVGGGRGFSLFVPAVLYPLLILTVLFFPANAPGMLKESPQWFNSLLYFVPIASTLLVSIVPVTLISWLRSNEYQTTHKQLELLGKYEGLLAGVEGSSKKPKAPDQFSELQFRRRAQSVLEDLCSHKALFWYDSGCMWLIKNHQDRGSLLLPGAFVNFREVTEFKQGINAENGFLSTEEFVAVPSVKHRHGKWQTYAPRFRSDLNAPAAFVPLNRENTRIGILALYGREGGPPPQRQDKAFLESLGSILSNTMEQWEGRFKAFPQREMNELFKCQTLDDVFNKVVVILQRYLMSGACEVIFRADEKAKQMAVVAALGFSKKRVGMQYKVERGRTGECAEKGITIRVDDVREYQKKRFDKEYFETLGKAYGQPITSWMAVPIGGKGQNHGVIKVVNRTFGSEWFSDEDQGLAEDLALRLQVIIEKFLYIQQTEEARREAEEQARQAERHAKQASAEQKKAETAARQRQMDLMTMTHQLQGPLNPVIGALSGIDQTMLSRNVLEEIEFAKALAESCLTLCWGTSAAFAKIAGQTISFSFDDIDAPTEMRKLCRMLELTNTDNELTFRYRQDPDFPKLRMDPAVFTSVLFSLIHNAMKYAEKNSVVYLECTFERSEPALKVKSVGVPIYPNEKELIFEPFERGRAVKNTSLKYQGTGLGLWVARQLMLAAGGNLTLELSEQHPDLSVFVVHIPGQ